ncbi:hypothetical protein ACK3TF_001985 [Chlorella vulgaris]
MIKAISSSSSTVLQRRAVMAATKPNLKITVTSDLACPWCYVGLRRLDKALARMPEVKADKEWHAFLLDWGAHASGLPIQEALAKKFGSQGEQIMQRIFDAGRPDGAEFANWKWRANTVKGHMLVALARRYGKSHEANELLFLKSYETGENISDTDVILDVGRQLGLPEEELQASFSSGGLDEGLLKEVQQSDTFAKQE